MIKICKDGFRALTRRESMTIIEIQTLNHIKKKEASANLPMMVFTSIIRLESSSVKLVEKKQLPTRRISKGGAVDKAESVVNTTGLVSCTLVGVVGVVTGTLIGVVNSTLVGVVNSTLVGVVKAKVVSNWP